MGKMRSKSSSDKNQTIGKHVRYIGMGDNWYVCSVCNKKFLRGFFWEEGDKSGCKQHCLSKLIKNEQGEM